MSGIAGQLLVGAIGGMVAALVTSLLSFLSVKVTLDRQRESNRLEDERRLRDARRERLRGSIECLLAACLVAGQVVADRFAIISFESPDERNKRHQEMLEAAWADLDKARIRLMIEASGHELVALVDTRILGSFLRLRAAFGIYTQHPATVDDQSLAEDKKELEAAIEALRLTARRVLTDLDRPL